MLARLLERQNGVIFGVRFERRKVDMKANLHENWNMQTLFRVFWIFFAKYHIFVILSYSVSKLVHFWDTVYTVVYNSMQWLVTRLRSWR